MARVSITGFFVLMTCFAFGQDMLGTWTLDWTQVFDTVKSSNPMVADGLTQLENGETANLTLWTVTEDSLIVERMGLMRKAISIEWKSETQFEFKEKTREGMVKFKVHYLDDGRLRMSHSRSAKPMLLKRIN